MFVTIMHHPHFIWICTGRK